MFFTFSANYVSRSPTLQPPITPPTPNSKSIFDNTTEEKRVLNYLTVKTNMQNGMFQRIIPTSRCNHCKHK
jgi:hypothetical protein